MFKFFSFTSLYHSLILLLVINIELQVLDTIKIIQMYKQCLQERDVHIYILNRLKDL